MNLFSSRSPHVVAAAVMLVLAQGVVVKPAFSQQLNNPDVIGVSLGQTADAVEAALRAHEPKLQISKISWRGSDKKPSQAVAKIIAGTAGYPMDSGSMNWARPESLAIYFTQTDSRVMGVYRFVNTGNQGVLAADLNQALSAKYGTMTTTQIGIGYLSMRGLDAQGQVANPRCVTSGFDWMIPPREFAAGCGQSIRVEFQDPIAPGVFRGYRTWLYDNQRAAADAAASQAEANALRDQANRKAVESAKTQKQAL